MRRSVLRIKPVRWCHRLWRMALGRARLEVAGMTARFHLTSKQDYASLWGGHFERDQIETFLALLRDGDVVYDVGANAGTWTAFVAQRIGRGHVHAFEPEPRNAERLRANMELNEIRNVTVHPMAASDKNGTADLGIHDRAGSGRHSLIRGRKHTRTIEVPTLRLDEAAARLRIPEPTAVKIDVEGAEWFVLQGARSLLENAGVRLLCIELHPDEIERTGRRPEEIFDLIERSGLKRSFGSRRGDQDFGIFARTT